MTDEDGCPDADDDADGVIDVEDRCPREPGVVDNGGCPDPDRDADTVVDRLDNCPDEPGLPANAGCKAKQLVRLTGDKIEILDAVYFRTDKADIRSKSFKLRRDADGYLRQIEADRMRGVVTDPRGSDETLFDYSKRWLDTRSSTLAPRTVELYRSELNKWIVPTFGALKLSAITTERVRMWHGATAAHSSPITAAKCYRLLRTILGNITMAIGTVN